MGVDLWKLLKIDLETGRNFLTPFSIEAEILGLTLHREKLDLESFGTAKATYLDEACLEQGAMQRSQD